MTGQTLLPRTATLVVLAVAAIAVAATGHGTAHAQQPLTPEMLRNLSYPSEFTAGGTAPLADGSYSEPAAPGSATSITVTFVDAAIAGDTAAVVLATSPGGSGTFFTLHLVSDAAPTPQAGAGTDLGDRIVLHSIAIDASGNVVLALTAHAETDPLCCPTQEQTRVYSFDAAGFHLLSTTLVAGGTPPAPSETGTAGLAGSPRTSNATLVLLAVAAAALVAGGRVTSRRRG